MTAPIFRETAGPPYAAAPAAPKRVSTSIQRTRSVDERGRTSREHVIPIRLATDSTSATSSRTQNVQERHVQRQSVSSQRREHIIPVQLSPFPARRSFLQETAANRRHSTASSLGWSEADWDQLLAPESWQTPDWGRPVHSAAWPTPDWTRPASVAVSGADTAVWPELDRQQPAFCCPVVGGPQAAALASLYSAPALTGTAHRT